MGQHAVLEEKTCLWNNTMRRDARNKGSIIKTEESDKNSASKNSRATFSFSRHLFKAVCFYGDV